ncbi:hypothetical protein NF27_CX00010 [Candidatus Jidaibacter acanthamoeba]|uniref:Uncharacterized protein n=2 Tax=Candidatus Jidaibacter acanthamoebae TaxID=86105 RepID=A0A0C1R0E2_9RICK|nr:hypothetical protein NF27_CX00010 [Candidatus Jidaibacter acanthamoeba]
MKQAPMKQNETVNNHDNIIIDQQNRFKLACKEKNHAAIVELLKLQPELLDSVDNRTASFLFLLPSQTLADILKNNWKSPVLNLQGFIIGKEEAEVLAYILKDNKIITYVNLLRTNIGSRGIKILAGTLKQNKIIKAINLGENYLQDEGAYYVAEILKENKSITTISLQHNNIEDEGAISLAEAIIINGRTSKINLSDNKIGQRGSIALIEALMQIDSINYVNLGGNNLGDKCVKAYCKMLESNKSIASINLANCKIGVEGLKALIDVLKDNNKVITSLDLEGNNITDEGIKLLSEILINNESITHVNLSNNKIGEKGAEYLANVLTKNHTIISINLRGNQLKDQGIKTLCTGLSNNQSIYIFDISKNQIGGSGANHIGKLLDGNCRFTSINLMENNYKVGGIKLLLEILEKKKTILSTDLTDISITKKDKNLLELQKKLKTHVSKNNQILEDTCKAVEEVSLININLPKIQLFLRMISGKVASYEQDNEVKSRYERIKREINDYYNFNFLRLRGIVKNAQSTEQTGIVLPTEVWGLIGSYLTPYNPTRSSANNISQNKIDSKNNTHDNYRKEPILHKFEVQRKIVQDRNTKNQISSSNLRLNTRKGKEKVIGKQSVLTRPYSKHDKKLRILDLIAELMCGNEKSTALCLYEAEVFIASNNETNYELITESMNFFNYIVRKNLSYEDAWKNKDVAEWRKTLKEKLINEKLKDYTNPDIIEIMSLKQCLKETKQNLLNMRGQLDKNVKVKDSIEKKYSYSKAQIEYQKTTLSQVERSLGNLVNENELIKTHIIKTEQQQIVETKIRPFEKSVDNDRQIIKAYKNKKHNLAKQIQKKLNQIGNKISNEMHEVIKYLTMENEGNSILREALKSEWVYVNHKQNNRSFCNEVTKPLAFTSNKKYPKGIHPIMRILQYIDDVNDLEENSEVLLDLQSSLYMGSANLCCRNCTTVIQQINNRNTQHSIQVSDREVNHSIEAREAHEWPRPLFISKYKNLGINLLKIDEVTRSTNVASSLGIGSSSGIQDIKEIPAKKTFSERQVSKVERVPHAKQNFSTNHKINNPKKQWREIIGSKPLDSDVNLSRQ